MTTTEQATWLAPMSEVALTPEYIAAGLARIQRYGGKYPRRYSVASHSVLVCRLLPVSASVNARKWALLHDAHEIETGDIPAPVARALGDVLQTIIDGIDGEVKWHLEVYPDPTDVRQVHAADMAAREIEIAAVTDPTYLESQPEHIYRCFHEANAERRWLAEWNRVCREGV